MSSAVADSSRRIGPFGIKQIIAAGLAGATVDALYFSILASATGSRPYEVLQGIAAFWMGKAAKHAGAPSILLGLFTHIAVATIMATGLAFGMARLPLLRRSAWLVGSLYGLVLYIVMYFVVLPLRWPSAFLRFHGFISVLDVLVHMAVGLAMAVALHSKNSQIYRH